MQKPELSQHLSTATHTGPDVSADIVLTGNPGLDFDEALLDGTQANRSAIERRVQSLAGRRSVKSAWQAAWMIKAITLIDLTTLSGDDTGDRVRRLAAKARQPVRQEILDGLGLNPRDVHVAAICVYHDMIGHALDAVRGTGIEVAAVSTGFPAGLSPMQLRIQEIRESVKAGADEIDVVISRRHVLAGNWRALHDEVREFRAACNGRKLKVILATGELGTLRNVARASRVSMMAGADFIKTSTGKEPVNSTLPVALVMMRAIRSYYQATGFQVGFKPAGGISTATDAIRYMVLLREELGNRWLDPRLFRFGASSLLADLERQLEHRVSGHYSAFYRNPVG